MPNIFDPEFDEARDREGFARDRAWIGKQAGAKKLGASVWIVEPGDAAYPYHFHYSDEEMLIVLEGTPSLRTPEGWRDLEAGEVVAFPVGEESAHQLVNRTEKQVRFLAISTRNDVDLVIYPDSEKVLANYHRREPDEFHGLFRKADQVGYWDGEEPPK